MAEIVLLHVGAPKTGTSYLQQMIWRNAEALVGQGLQLPLGARRAQFDAVADMRGGPWTPEHGWATWDELVADTRRHPGRSLVSEELLCATPEAQIRQVVDSLAPAAVHVVIGARDLGRQIPAEWQQALRARSAMDYESWLTSLRDDPERPFWRVQDPVRVVDRWSTAVPRENIHVLTVPPPGAPSTVLWERFASLLDVDPAAATAPPAPQNQSLGKVESELLRRVNSRLGDRFPMRVPYDQVVRRHFITPGLMGAGTGRLGIPEPHRGWVRERSARISDELAAAGVHVVGDVRELVTEHFDVDANPDVSDGELLEVSLTAWIRVLEHLEQTTVNPGRDRQIARLRRRAARLEAELEQVRSSRAYRLARRVRRRRGPEVAGSTGG